MGKGGPQPCARDAICSERLGPVTFMPPASSCPSSQLRLPTGCWEWGAGGQGECAQPGGASNSALAIWISPSIPCGKQRGYEDLWVGREGAELLSRGWAPPSSVGVEVIPTPGRPPCCLTRAGLGWEEGQESSRWVRLWWGWAGSPTVFDVPTGHLAQVKATVYVFLSLTCRGEFPVIFFGGRGSFCLSNQSPPYTPTPISH